MKVHPLFIKLLMMTSLVMSISAQANEKIADNAKQTSAQAECGADLLPSPKPITSGKVSYISGGICITGVQQMKNLAKDYPLEVVLVEKTDEYEKESYIADVKVTIKDVRENLILDTSTEGPFLLVNLTDGLYQITAEYNGIVKEKVAKVSSNKHSRIVFLWTKEAESQ